MKYGYLVTSLIYLIISTLEAVNPGGAGKGRLHGGNAENSKAERSQANISGNLPLDAAKSEDDEEPDDFGITMPRNGNTSGYVDRGEDNDDESFDFSEDYSKFFDIDVVADDDTTTQPGQDEFFVVPGINLSDTKFHGGSNISNSGTFGGHRGNGKRKISLNEFMGINYTPDAVKRGPDRSDWIVKDFETPTFHNKGGGISAIEDNLVKVPLENIDKYIPANLDLGALKRLSEAIKIYRLTGELGLSGESSRRPLEPLGEASGRFSGITSILPGASLGSGDDLSVFIEGIATFLLTPGEPLEADSPLLRDNPDIREQLDSISEYIKEQIKEVLPDLFDETPVECKLIIDPEGFDGKIKRTELLHSVKLKLGEAAKKYRFYGFLSEKSFIIGVTEHKE